MRIYARPVEARAEGRPVAAHGGRPRVAPRADGRTGASGAAAAGRVRRRRATAGRRTRVVAGLLAHRSARRHQGVPRQERRVHGERGADRGIAAHARRRGRARARSACSSAMSRTASPAVSMSSGVRDLRARRYHGAPATVVASRRHGGDAARGRARGRSSDEHGPIELRNVGSALKLCLLAEGEADVYPRLAPTSEWDTAAAQAVLEAAGGAVLQLSGNSARLQQAGDSEPRVRRGRGSVGELAALLPLSRVPTSGPRFFRRASIRSRQFR